MIKAAELRTVTTELDQFKTALYSFQQKYFGLPGDIRNATDFWDTDPDGCPTHTNFVGKSETCDGDGDGRIEITDGEIFRAWQQLASAGLVQGQYSGVVVTGWIIDHDIGMNAPASNMRGGGYGIQYQDDFAGDGNWYPIAGGNHVLFFGKDIAVERPLDPIVTTTEAWNIDTKIDDGKPGLGSVRTWRPGGNVNPSCTDDTDANDAAQLIC